MNFGEKIRALRQDRGLTQQQVADDLGISLRAWVYYENGHRFPPQPLLRALSEYFGVSADSLISEREPESLIDSLPTLSPQDLLQQVGSLLAGGHLDAEDRAKFLSALDEIRSEAEKRAQQHKAKRINE